MALLSTLVKVIADVEGLDETQVGWIARHLREAGHITQAGRGRGAAQMTARDAVNLLIGVNASRSAKEAASAVHLFRELRLVRDLDMPDDLDEWKRLRAKDDGFSRAFSPGIKLGETLDFLVSTFIPSDNAQSLIKDRDILYITFERPYYTCEVGINFAYLKKPGTYTTSYFEEFDKQIGWNMPDKTDQTTITRRTISAVGMVLAK